MNEYAAAAEEGPTNDPWEGFAHFVTAAVLAGTGALGPIAGTVEVTEAMSAVAAHGDAAAEKVIRRAQAAGVLRDDVAPVDVALLIEQLGRSPLVEQLTKQGHADLLDVAGHAVDDSSRSRSTDFVRPRRSLSRGRFPTGSCSPSDGPAPCRPTPDGPPDRILLMSSTAPGDAASTS